MVVAVFSTNLVFGPFWIFSLFKFSKKNNFQKGNIYIYFSLKIFLVSLDFKKIICISDTLSFLIIVFFLVLKESVAIFNHIRCFYVFQYPESAASQKGMVWA